MAGLSALGGSGLLAGKSLAVLGAGLLSGAVAGGALVASGTVEFGASAGAGGGATGAGLELVPCPDQGPVLGTIPRDQKVLVTARSADGGWLQLYWPAPGIERAWIMAGPLQLEGDLASLPVAECEAPPTATPRPTVEPTPTPEVTPTPTPTPILQPTTEPTPSAGRERRAEALGPHHVDLDDQLRHGQVLRQRPEGGDDLGGRVGRRRHRQRLALLPLDRDRDVQVGADDALGRQVRRHARHDPRQPEDGGHAAVLRGGDRPGRQPEVRAPARLGRPRGGDQGLQEHRPEVHAADGEPDLDHHQPAGHRLQRGSTLSELRARATDVDGVKSIRALLQEARRERRYSSRAFSLDGDTWYSYVNTVGTVDNIVRSGTISWYAVATDGKGATTKSAVKSIKVTRCDSEANFDVARSYSPDQIPVSVHAARVTIRIYADRTRQPRRREGAQAVARLDRSTTQRHGTTLKSRSVSMTKPAGATAVARVRSRPSRHELAGYGGLVDVLRPDGRPYGGNTYTPTSGSARSTLGAS